MKIVLENQSYSSLVSTGELESAGERECMVGM